MFSALRRQITAKPGFLPIPRLCSSRATPPPNTLASPDSLPPQTTTNCEPDKLYKTLDIELKCAEPATLKSYTWFAEQAAKHFEIECKTWSSRKSEKDRLILLKSAFVHKKHRVQYEVRTYFRFMQFYKLTGSTMDTFLEYIERNLPEGVALKATKVELQMLPEYLKKPNTISNMPSDNVDK